MKKFNNKKYKVMASFYSTYHNKIWFSSGCVTLYVYLSSLDNLKFSILGGDDE